MKKIGSVAAFVLSSFYLPAQALVGTTGLLGLPSADMQEAGTLSIGGTVLNKHFCPAEFTYQTYNYYANASVLSFCEISFSKTLLKLDLPDDPDASGKFNNADRSLSARFRLVQESKKLPALVIGMNDIYSQSNHDFMGDGQHNQYFGKVYAALRKSFGIAAAGMLETHLIYQYERNFGQSLYKGCAAALAFRPAFCPGLQLISEYDVSKHNWNNGFNAYLFRHFFAQFILQNGKYISGGIALQFHLNPINRKTHET